MAKRTNTVTQSMYIGPNVRKHGLVQYRVYRGDISSVFGELSKTYSLIRQLVVPLSDIATAKAKMETPGTPQYLACQQILGGEA